jgi:uncharacterized protein YndB with AHSA1/START domain
VIVHFPVPCEVAFDYLADPRHRAEWQSSLSRVAGVVGEPGVGQRWQDVTRPGLRAAMETTEYDRPHRWAEAGTWRGFRAVLALDFHPAADGCDVEVTASVRARGLLAPIGRLADLVAPYALRSDLRHAASRLTP